MRRPSGSVPFRAVLALATLSDDRGAGQACQAPTFGITTPPQLPRATAGCCRDLHRPPGRSRTPPTSRTTAPRPPGTCNVPLHSESPHHPNYHGQPRAAPTSEPSPSTLGQGTNHRRGEFQTRQPWPTCCHRAKVTEPLTSQEGIFAGHQQHRTYKALCYNLLPLER